MVRTLGWIAAGGLGVGVISLSLAYVTGDDAVHRLMNVGTSFASTCGSSGTPATLSERHLKWNGGDTIEIALPATVRYRGGEGDEVIVRGAPDVIAHVEIRGDRLSLDCRNIARLREIEVVLPGQKFRRIGLAGSGKVLMENVNQPELALHVSGSGDLSVQGKVDRATISITGSGHARLADLGMKEFTAKVAGSGNVEAAPTDLADISISGAGNVRLLTHPAQLRSHISGSGRITEAALGSADTKK